MPKKEVHKEEVDFPVKKGSFKLEISLILLFVLLSAIAILSAPDLPKEKMSDNFFDFVYGIVAILAAATLYKEYKLLKHRAIFHIFAGLLILAFMRAFEIYLQSKQYFEPEQVLPDFPFWGINYAATFVGVLILCKGFKEVQRCH